MIADREFHIIKDAISTDERGNLTIGEEAKTKVYRVMINEAGQILLDPVAIPERERWLSHNLEALAAVQLGIQQAAAGELHDLGSFAQYADLEIDD